MYLSVFVFCEDEGEDSELIFFCGDQRRDELPGILRNNDIEVNEIVVYQTVIVPHKVDKKYHGILFFSPSAVKSFFSLNKLNEEIRVFAIGKTTADAIQKNTDRELIIAETPGEENMIDQVIAHFSTTKTA